MIQLLLPVIYLSFVSLGLPDALLGAAWPSAYIEFGVPVSYAGIIAIIISGGTMVSSLFSGYLIQRLGTGKMTALSVGATAVALFGFSVSGSFWVLCLWAIPYGLGAGSVDAALNNYVALHYESRHMSWLHCMWGLGASLGPYIMGVALTGGQGWKMGYRYISYLQIGLTAVLILSLPLWKKQTQTAEKLEEPKAEALSLLQVIRIPGAKEIMMTFFCYCALEQTAGLWASSYLALHHGFSEEQAASFASMFFLGITAGRALSGFATMKFSDTKMVRLGFGVIAVGIAAMLLPLGTIAASVGLVLTGLGCAPIYPCVLHSTPEHFGAERSQAMIGMQMASASLGVCFMPPLFGVLADHITVALLPVFLFILLGIMSVMHFRLLRLANVNSH